MLQVRLYLNFLDIQINWIFMIPVLIIEDHDDNADDERDSKTSLGAAQYQQVPAQGKISLKPNALIAYCKVKCTHI